MNLSRIKLRRSSRIIKTAERVWGKEASGILILCGNEVLLQLRSGRVQKPDTWSIPGGAVKGTDGSYDSKELKDYKAVSFRQSYESAIKELDEEGFEGLNLKSKKWKSKYTHKLDYFRYVTFVVEISKEEKEKVDFEKDAEVKRWKWFKKGELPKKLHPGFKEFIESDFGKKLGLKIK
jgi:8-oxo-dGTP pyrophosphatase MutT (NUDIX family)